MRFLLLLSLCFIVSTSAQAQKKSKKSKKWYHEATVQLKNGSVLKGELISMNEDTVKVKIVGGSIFVYPQSDVKLITVSEDRTYTAVKSFKYRRTGLMYGLTATSNFGQNEDGGIGLNAVVMYQYNNYLAAGVNTGFHAFSAFNGVRTIPIQLQVSGNLSEKPVTPYYHLGLGYAFALENTDFDIIRARGGLSVHPALGIRFDMFNGSTFLMDFGYQFQNVEITTQRFNGINIDDIRYQRFSVRLGLLF
jgi:hypothetical protein